MNGIECRAMRGTDHIVRILDAPVVGMLPSTGLSESEVAHRLVPAVCRSGKGQGVTANTASYGYIGDASFRVARIGVVGAPGVDVAIGAAFTS